MPIIHRYEQGSLEWHRVRLGIPTASMFHRIVTPVKGDLSEQAKPYMYRLVTERLFGEAIEDNLERVEWIERGSMAEPHARREFSRFIRCEIEQVGFITDNKKRWGASPDGLLMGKSECCEIKCPKPETQVGRLLAGFDKKTAERYRPQVQGQLWIGEFEAAHFYSWHERLSPYYALTLRDDEYIDKLEIALQKFVAELDKAHNHARTMGFLAQILPHEAGQDAG